MRFSLSLALVALATAAALASAPASAAETCEMGRAVYTSKADGEYQMMFRPGGQSMPGVVAAITRKGWAGSYRLADLGFTYSMGYSVLYATGSSPAIEASPGETPLGGRVVALNVDFSEAGIGSPEAAAPFAIILPDIGSQLYNATKHDPERQTSIPEGAWILTACR